MTRMFGQYYRNKRVLLTGHTGFKGAWMGLWLKRLEAHVTGIGLPAPTQPNFHEILSGLVFDRQIGCDIRDADAVQKALAETAPEIIFHLAAQPLVRASYASPLETLQTNTLGTANLLEAVRKLGLPSNVVVVTTDKCYENRCWDYGYREVDPLGGHDVYSASKAAAELVVEAWRRSFFLPDAKLGHIASARAGNVIGGGDYAKDRIVPDCVRALIGKRPVEVRNPASTRPWQHVLDCVSGYLWLGAKLGVAPKDSPLDGAFNFGPGPRANRPVSEVVAELLKTWPGEWRHQPPAVAPHEAHRLNLSIDKAAALLGWFPTWTFEEAVIHTATWYHQRHALNKPNMVQFSLAQIESFTEAARQRRLAWAEDAAP